MTTIPPTTIEELSSPQSSVAPDSWWTRAWARFEVQMVALADRANPILVKEARQALKSRQFVVTFLIVLVACLIVSFVRVAMIGPEIYYAAAGPDLLLWYYAILCVPLALIVPFTAFRSLAAEQEENTYDLLSITTLGSRQIVTGKLTSAMVQMLVYLCAVSPCIAFTFLLRGVDAIMLVVLLTLAILGSLGLSMIALLIGSVARVRNTQVVISVGLILGLAGALVAAVMLGYVIIEEGSSVFREPEFWMVAFGLITIYATTFGLLHAAASAQIAFVSENRSTALRWWMMTQQACFCGFVGAGLYAMSLYNDNEQADILMIGGAFAAMYWYFMGTMLTGEWPHLSRRVQRSLPQSTLGRAFLSLFNPGPGAGYLFAVANLTMITVMALIFLWLTDQPGTRGGLATDTVAYFLVLSWAYVVAFLGFGRLLIVQLRRWTYVPLAAAFLIHIVLLMTAIGVPTIIQLTSRQLRNAGYTLLQMSNPMWTLTELVDDGVMSVRGEVLILVIPAFAIMALILNMRSVATELLHHRIAAPVRIVEDEAELHPAPAPKPTSPWEIEDET
jgi:hypothetical protein